MDAESFNALALRVISREATDAERRELEAELSSTPARRAEFEDLKLTHEILQTTAPTAQAIGATRPELPAHRVNELRTAVRQHFGPVVNREKAAAFSAEWKRILRWLFAGSGIGALGFAVVVFCFADRSIEIGLYRTDLVRSGDQGLMAENVPAAHLVVFDGDAPFSDWQNQPLAWSERAKIWVDNEHDLLHIVRRVRQGQVVIESRPLAPTNEGQRAQIEQVVGELGR
jgi:hypothetical protein